MEDCKGDDRRKAREGEDGVGDDVQDGELGFAPVGEGSAGVEDQPKVGQVVADALRLHLVAPLTHHLLAKQASSFLHWKVSFDVIFANSKLLTLQPSSLQSCREEFQKTH